MNILNYKMEKKEKKPNKYNHGRIYKLIDSFGFYYIGSTCNSLSHRLSGHRVDSKRRPNAKIYKQITNWNDISIVLMVEVNVENKEQLVREEDKYIDRNDPFCLNSYRSFLTEEQKKQYRVQNSQQYNTENREKIHQQKQKYYNENKEYKKKYTQQYRREHKEQIQHYLNENQAKISTKRNVLLKCICGLDIKKGSFKKHLMSQKHQRLIKTNEQENIST